METPWHWLFDMLLACELLKKKTRAKLKGKKIPGKSVFSLLKYNRSLQNHSLAVTEINNNLSTEGPTTSGKYKEIKMHTLTLGLLMLKTKME